jgi:polysaccharide pyruvyl transferase CsaB
MKKKMILCGNYGAGNIGDEAILRALIQKFEADHEIVVISANPKATNQDYNVQAVRRFPGGIRSKLNSLFNPVARKSLKITREAVNSSDVFVLGGGTLLTDTPLSSIIIWSKQVEPAFKAGKEVWVHASGIGPVESEFAQQVTHSILDRAHRVSVRDLKSVERTKALGIHKAEKVMDPVFDLQWKSEKPDMEIDENTVIFVPRFWRKNIDEVRGAFIKFVRYLCLEEGRKVVGIPFEKDNFKDVQFLTTIFEQANVGETAKVWRNYNDEIDVINAIDHAGMVVGMRLHSLIFAEITKTPFVGVAYMEKVAALGETLKKSDCIVDVDTISFESLKQAYKASLNSDL